MRGCGRAQPAGGQRALASTPGAHPLAPAQQALAARPSRSFAPPSPPLPSPTLSLQLRLRRLRLLRPLLQPRLGGGPHRALRAAAALWPVLLRHEQLVQALLLQRPLHAVRQARPRAGPPLRAVPPRRVPRDAPPLLAVLLPRRLPALPARLVLEPEGAPVPAGAPHAPQAPVDVPHAGPQLRAVHAQRAAAVPLVPLRLWQALEGQQVHPHRLVQPLAPAAQLSGATARLGWPCATL